MPSLPPSTRPAAAPGAGTEAEIEITALGLAGDGIGHLEGHTVFVPYAAPGDRLRIRLEGEGEGGWRARILERLADGADRAEAPCPHFADCGGCTPAASDARGLSPLEAGAGGARRSPAGASKRWWRLCSSCRPAAGDGRFWLPRRRPMASTLGFNAAGSSRIVDLSLCLLLTPKLQAFLAPLRRALAPVLRRGERADAMVTETESGIDLWLQLRHGTGAAGRRSLMDLAEAEDLARISLGTDAELLAAAPHAPDVLRRRSRWPCRPAPSCSRAPLGEAALVRAVTTLLKGRKRIADLYAGCGTFTFALAAGRRSFMRSKAMRPPMTALAAAARGLGGRVVTRAPRSGGGAR